jgi:hypothetical protein
MAKTKHHLCYTIRDFEKMYRKETSMDDTISTIKPKVYRSMMKKFFKLLSKKIIRDNYHFKIPYRLGLIKITKVKTTLGADASKDYNKSNKLGKTVYYTNRHSSGYYFRWIWIKSIAYANFKNILFYKFKPNRGLDGVSGKKGLSKWIIKCSNDPEVKDYDVIK